MQLTKPTGWGGLTEVDGKTNPLKIKGVGELGICGAGVAVANAVYNACGVRIRDFPMTLAKVIAGMGKLLAGDDGIRVS